MSNVKQHTLIKLSYYTMLLLSMEQSYCHKKTYVPSVKSKYFNIAELLQNALASIVPELLSQITYAPNVRSKFLNIAEVVHNALVDRDGELLSQRKYVPNLQ